MGNMIRVVVLCNIWVVLAASFALSIYAVYFPSYMSSGDKVDNIFWFVQVSDIHISRYWDPERPVDFKHFCIDTLGIIRPDIVIVTGDLTDAKSRNKLNSQQYKDEWQTYSQILDDCNASERYIWLDIRGNHDAFDVMKVDDPKSNLYLKYSGDKGKLSSKVYHLEKPFGIYSFIPVDATMIPGPRRPYNFAGKRYSPLHYLGVILLMKMLQDIFLMIRWTCSNHLRRRHQKSNFTIWYSHYPTTSITSRNPGVRNLVGEFGSVYIAGHLHTLAGVSKSLYAMNSRGFAELELGDWQVERIYRIAVIDHDLFSFTDQKYNEWPAIVLTNPKWSNLMMPKFEPLKRIALSSHIRFLIFDPWKIEQVRVAIDGKLLPEEPQQVNWTNLWVCRWDSDAYKYGTHDISITVVDTEGNRKTVLQQFSMDVSWNVDFGWISPIILLTEWTTLLRLIFHSIIYIYIGLMVLLTKYRVNFNMQIISKVRCLLRNKVAYYGLLGFPLNLSLGPWFIGEVIRGSTGVCFSYGVLVGGILQPDDITLHISGIQIMLLLYIPGVFLLSEINDVADTKNKFQMKHPSFVVIFITGYLLFLAFNVYAIWELYESYGYVAAMLSPFKLWWAMYFVTTSYKIYYKGR